VAGPLLALLAVLPGTLPWNLPSDIVGEQRAELQRFYEGQLARGTRVSRDELKRLIGAVDAPLAPKAVETKLGESEGLRVSLVEWPVYRLGSLPPTTGGSGAVVKEYGLLWEPEAAGRFPAVISLPDVTPGAMLDRPRANHVTFTPLFPERRALGQPWIDDRQFLFRLACQTGRHIIGSEVMQVLSAADFLAARPSVDTARISLAGRGQGALTARLAAAADPRFSELKADAESVPVWETPDDRIVWRWRDVGASLGPFSPNPPAEAADWPLSAARRTEIASHQFRQWEAFYRNRAVESERARDALRLVQRRAAYQTLLGDYPRPDGPFDARSVLLYDTPKFKGWRLSVAVRDGVHAYGILLVPNGIRAGEKRPVVFVQHGLAGSPEDAIGEADNPRANEVYRRLGKRLAERGYVVFAPLVSVQEFQGRASLVRRAHRAGMMPAGADAWKFNRVLDFLETLPLVDKNRFAFYGLSYGGYTALWTGPAVPRFRVVIASGHFNHWQAKTTDLTIGTSYLLYPEVTDMYNFGVLNSLDHSDLAALIAPRPFFIEMGEQDGVIVEPRMLVENEIRQVEEEYRRQGVAGRFAVGRFDGPHRIDGAAAFDFLDRALGWSPR